MKRAFAALCLAAVLVCCVSCANKTEERREENISNMKSVEEIISQSNEADLCGGTETKKLVTPFYTSQIQYNEGFFLLENADGSVSDAQLLFPIEKILDIRSNDLQTVYKEGADYEIVDGKIRITANSAMRVMPRSEFFLSDDAYADFLYNSSAGEDAGKKPVTDKTALYPYRYAATYIRAEIYDGFVPASKGARLSSYAEKVRKKEPLNFMYVGDSIGTGAGASGELTKLADLVALGATERAGVRVTMRNASVGGLNSDDFQFVLKKQFSNIREEFRNSAQNAMSVIEKYAEKTDVVFIALGANDCAGSMPASKFALNVCNIIDYFRDANKSVSVVLVSSMDISHKVKKSPEKGGADLNGYDIGKYAAELTALEKEYSNLVCADIFNFQKSLLKRKQWEDLIADNLNHPCDYMQRIYAQGILATLFV